MPVEMFPCYVFDQLYDEVDTCFDFDCPNVIILDGPMDAIHQAEWNTFLTITDRYYSGEYRKSVNSPLESWRKNFLSFEGEFLLRLPRKGKGFMEEYKPFAAMSSYQVNHTMC